MTKGSRGQWMQRHLDDEYVKRAQRDGYRSRAVYKLLEIDDQYHILGGDRIIVDLGSAPGGWSQIAAKKRGKTGEVYALDLLPMTGIPGVHFFQGDFREQSVLDQLNTALNGKVVDLVLSDMAPNISGIKAVDQPSAMYLAELTLDFACQTLKPGGGMMLKLFQGEGFDQYCREVRRSFDKVVIKKPKASRAKSREVYLLARAYKRG
ncbi:23S rRNA (uridine(2552)-2'-O)-methyltransferase [hydrothermal vent metagenome]|uniref:23S rRNA (Uridine(2552)-2'-O)-methyltransferase n=1 Tax=hydrothermal vent metagenome TaxID=652676 RepID=A0A3B1A388_9ZZZZ